MSDRCRITVGRLISHPCARPARAFCPTCRRPVCPEHVSDAGDGRCRECTREIVPPKAPVHVDFEELMDFSPAEIQAFDADGDSPGVGLVGS